MLPCRYVFPLVLIFQFSFFCSAQSYAPKDFYLVDSLVLSDLSTEDQGLLDSALKDYHGSKSDLERAKALEIICEDLINVVWWKYQHIQYKLIQRINQTDLKGQDLLTYRKAYGLALNNMGVLYAGKGRLGDAVEYYTQGLKIRKEIDDKDGIAETLDNLGEVYYDQGKVKVSVEYLHDALMIRIQRNDKLGMAESYNTLGMVLSYGKSYDIAEQYERNALRLYTELNYESGLATTQNNLGALFSGRGNYEKALECYEKCLEIRRKLKDEFGVAQTLVNIGTIYLNKGILEKSLQYFYNAQDIYKSLGAQKGIASVSIKIGHVYVNMGDQEKASEFIEQGYTLSKNYGYMRSLRRAAQFLHKIYEDQNRIRESLEMHKLFVQINDSISKKEVFTALVTKDYEHHLKKKDKEIELLDKEKQLKSTQLKFSFIVYGVILLVVIGVSIALFRYRRARYERELNTLRSLKIEQEREQEKEKIAALSVTIGNKIISIAVEEVIYFKAESKYVFLQNEQGKSYIVDYTLSSLEKSLPDNFTRVHRATIVNNDKIEEIIKTNKGTVILNMKDEPSTKINSSRGYSENVKQLVKNFKQKKTI